MKIAVVAASGRTGTEFVKLALLAGHQVNAGIYGTSTNLLDKNLKEIKCDANSLDEVDNLIKNCDAVVSLIGHRRKSPADIQTAAIKNIVTAMQKQGLKRLVSLTGTGVRFSDDIIPFYDWPLNFFIKIIDPNRVRDGITHAKYIKDSKLDWTIIRVLKLTNSKKLAYRLSTNRPTKLLTSRTEVANAILEVLKENSFIRQSPVIAKP